MPDWNLEKKRFLSSILFYTRIPVSGFLTKDSLQKEEPIESSRYFPLTGILVGAACSLVFLATHYFLPKDISILIGLAVGFWITGALHEDGLADSADGFGAGWNPEQIRKIMRDSSIGVYGMLSLLFECSSNSKPYIRFRLSKYLWFGLPVMPSAGLRRLGF